MVQLVRNIGTFSTENELFASALRHWLRTQGCTGKYGALIVSLEDDGFSVLALGPSPISDRQTVEWLLAVAADLTVVAQQEGWDPPVDR